MKRNTNDDESDVCAVDPISDPTGMDCGCVGGI